MGSLRTRGQKKVNDQIRELSSGAGNGEIRWFEVTVSKLFYGRGAYNEINFFEKLLGW